MSETVINDINDVFSSLGAQGFLYAEDVHSHRSIGIRESARVPLASIAKVAIIASLLAAEEEESVDLSRRVEVDPSTATPGSTGICALQDPVTMSLRDLAAMALAVSDNAAADTLFDIVGTDRIASLLHRSGLRSLDIHSPMSHVYDFINEAAGGIESLALKLATEEVDSTVISRFPIASFNTGTARGVARMFEFIHTDRFIGKKGSEQLRRLLRGQIFRHRIAAGFPMDTVDYYGKTGTFLNFRHEAGIVADADGRVFSIAVFTRSTIAAFSQPELDASIGYCARLAIDHLRSESAD